MLSFRIVVLFTVFILNWKCLVNKTNIVNHTGRNRFFSAYSWGWNENGNPGPKSGIFVLRSKDVLHSFALPTLGIKSDCIPGKIIIDRTSPFSREIKYRGIFRGFCSELCGVNHSIMPILWEKNFLVSLNKNLALKRLRFFGIKKSQVNFLNDIKIY